MLEAHVRDLLPRELDRVRQLDDLGVAHAILEVSATGLGKSILDATKPVRAFFVGAGFHDYDQQSQGTEFKSLKNVELVSREGTARRVTMSLVRPASGNGDPRFWIYGLKSVCAAGDIVVLYINSGTMRVENLSDGVAEAAKLDTHDDATDGRSGSIIEAVLDRATGGSDVAARPTTFSEPLPTVHRAAGVDESISWLLAAGETPRMLFLVGGPGAGKSHAASSAVRTLKLLDPEGSDLANRTYNYLLGERRFRLVNDATISSPEFPVNPLANELRRAIDDQEIVLACVNRGVLVEELAALPRHEAGETSAERAILEWLSSPSYYASTLTSVDEQDGPVIVEIENEGYLVSGTLSSGTDVIAHLVVVNLDACSLLEQSPIVALGVTDPGSAQSLSPAPYRVAQFSDRHKLKVDATPAGDLFSKTFFLLNDETPSARENDPFAANVASMRSESVQLGMLSVLRAAEVVTASNFTFRDLWGIIGRSLLGDAPQQLGWRGTSDTVRSLGSESARGIDRFVSMQKLASYRYSQALFGVGDDRSGNARATRDPITRRTWLLDPARDAIPGVYRPASPASGWATPISDAFSGPVASGSPLETLSGSLSKDDPFFAAIQNFDQKLDEAYVDALQETRLGESQRATIVAWYGRYLMRLYALANGISAFRAEVDDWTLAWRMSPSLPTPLDTCLRTLIRPARSADSPPAIPALASRVEPIVGENAHPRIARTSGTFALETRREGDALLFRISESARSSPWIPLDFPMVRHAASCTAGAIGLTEVADVTSPRLERFRSTQLLNSGSAESDYVVIAGSNTFKIQLGG